MLTSDLFKVRQSNFLELSELSPENILSEATLSKVKNRKTKLFQKIMSLRNNLFLNKINNKKNNNNHKTEIINTNFKDILDTILSKEEKISFINSLFTNNMEKVQEIFSKNKKKDFIIDYNILSKSNYILNVIETQNDVIQILIQNEANLNFIINKIYLMGNEQIPYDSNYIMIYSYFLIYNENISKILKERINMPNILHIIIKNETEISYIYLLYIYSYIFYLSNEEIEQNENILNSLISIIIQINKKSCNDDHLLWEIYNLLTFFSKIPKFIQKFYENYENIFLKRDFYERDIITIEKLKIINNIFNNINNEYEQIILFIKKDNQYILNLIIFSLRILSSMKINTGENHIINNDIKIKLFLESIKILYIFTCHKELTHLFLENKKCIWLIINTFYNFFSLQNHVNNPLFNEIGKFMFEIVDNIIKYEHRTFIEIFIQKKVNSKIKIKDQFYNYLNNNYIYINIKDIQYLVNIILS